MLLLNFRGAAPLVLFTVFACSSSKLSTKEQGLKEVTSNKGCKVLGKVEGTGSWRGLPKDNEKVALKEVRTKVIKLGGDAFRIVEKPWDDAVSIVIAEALRCQPGVAPPTHRPSKLSLTGESCTRSDDCAGALRCVDHKCVQRASSSQPTSKPASKPTS